MTVQLCLSIGIILFSTVIYFQLDFIREKNLGFDKENMIRLEPTYRMLKSYDVFKSEALNSSAVTDMTVANVNPLTVNNSTTAVEWSGKSPDTQISFQTIGTIANFTSLFGLEVVEGRTFLNKKQTKDSLATEAIITAATARYFGFENPIGEKIRILNPT
jgi:hypothetical protein